MLHSQISCVAIERITAVNKTCRPMFSAPLSEVFGRKMVYFVNFPIFLLFTVGAALAHNIETLVICRMLSGIFGGPALAVSAGSFVDVWELKSSGLAVSVQAIATFMGPALGNNPSIDLYPSVSLLV